MKFPAFPPINLQEGTSSCEIIDLLLSKIIPNANQARKIFDENSLKELAFSIKKHGVIQPILVQEIINHQYQIIAGERRWRAAKMAGLEKIPAIIKTYNQPNRMAVSLIENIQRENLNPLEEAEAIQCLLIECTMTHSQVAESIGRSRATVSNLLRLLALIPEVKVMINSGLIEMGHARALLSLSKEQQNEIAELIVNKSLSVRETEKLIQRLNNKNHRNEVDINPEFKKKIMEWKDEISKQLSTEVKVQFNNTGKGKLMIYFNSVDEAEWLMDNLRKK